MKVFVSRVKVNWKIILRTVWDRRTEARSLLGLDMLTREIDSTKPHVLHIHIQRYQAQKHVHFFQLYVDSCIGRLLMKLGRH